MKQIISGILAVLAGAAMAYGITSTVSSANSCLESVATCSTDVTGGVPFIVGGSLAFIVAVVLWWGAWVVGPIVGLAVAAQQLIADGTTIAVGPAAFIAASVLLGPAILVVFALRGRSKQKLGAELVATGSRAVAQVQGAQETGVFINNRPQVRVSYLLHPLDGTPAFAHTKTQTLGYTEIPPRPGLAWPAWYDPTDQSKVAVGAPSGAALDPQTEQLLRDFGISVQQAYGYDPGRPGAPVGAPVAFGPAGS